MTDSDRSSSEVLHQALIRLRWSLDAFHCAADMLPANDEGEPLAYLFQIIDERVQRDLRAVFESLRFD